MRLFALLLLLSAGLNGWQHLTAQAERAACSQHLAEQTHDADLAALAQAENNTRRLTELARQNDHLQAQARATLAGLATALHQRTDKIEQLEHQNAALRLWADTALPADVQRLRERPGFASAAAYRQWLSTADGLSAPARQPENKP